MKWSSCFTIFWCYLYLVITTNLFVSYNVDVDVDATVESFSKGHIDHHDDDDDDDAPNFISIPVKLYGDTSNIATFLLAIEDYGYREVILSNFCSLHDLSYESYRLLMRHLDHQCNLLWNRRNDKYSKVDDAVDDHYTRDVISFPVYVADYENHSRTIHFVLNVSDTADHELSAASSSAATSTAPSASSSSTATSSIAFCLVFSPHTWGSLFGWTCTSKYEGSGWIRRCERISGNPIITSMQLSITLAVIPRLTS